MQTNVFVHGGVSISPSDRPNDQDNGDKSSETDSLAKQRQALYFDLLREQQTSYFDSWSQDRRHANAAFWAAVILMLASGLVLLAGGVMSLVQGDLEPLATVSLPGVPFAAIGTGLALYARKAKADTIARANTPASLREGPWFRSCLPTADVRDGRPRPRHGESGVRQLSPHPIAA
jgi:hypothetical protein